MVFLGGQKVCELWNWCSCDKQLAQSIDQSIQDQESPRNSYGKVYLFRAKQSVLLEVTSGALTEPLYLGPNMAAALLFIP